MITKKIFLFSILLIVMFSTTNLYSATYDLTGTWNYTLSGNWAQGDIGCNPGPAASGTCKITQTGDTFTFAFTSGVSCDPGEACTFSGAVTGNVYTCSTTDIVDSEGGSVTSTIVFTAGSATSGTGSGNSLYTHPTGEWSCSWGNTISLTKPSEQPQPGQYILTLIISGSGTVTLDPPGGIYNAGIQVQLTATPGLSESFNNWSGDLSGTDNPGSITMDSDKSVQLNFSGDSDDNGDDDDGGGGGGCFISVVNQ